MKMWLGIVASWAILIGLAFLGLVIQTIRWLSALVGRRHGHQT